MSLWDWTSAAYGRPGVADACLALQDEHGQSAPYLLWAVWARADDRQLLVAAAAVVRAWEAVATLPLRRVRRELKAPSPPIADSDREFVRTGAAEAELAAEKALLQALEELTPTPPRGRASPAQALTAAAEAWSGEAAPAPTEVLAQALSRGLLFEAPSRKDQAAPDAAPPQNEEDEAWERDLRARLAVVSQDHADLDAAIQALAHSPLPDMMVIGRLKRKKLALKDEIVRIQDELTPDIIA
jgi:uncharacterized protein (TIGR02444 family)